MSKKFPIEAVLSLTTGRNISNDGMQDALDIAAFLISGASSKEIGALDLIVLLPAARQALIDQYPWTDLDQEDPMFNDPDEFMAWLEKMKIEHGPELEIKSFNENLSPSRQDVVGSLREIALPGWLPDGMKATMKELIRLQEEIIPLIGGGSHEVMGEKMLEMASLFIELFKGVPKAMRGNIYENPFPLLNALTGLIHTATILFGNSIDYEDRVKDYLSNFRTEKKMEEVFLVMEIIKKTFSDHRKPSSPIFN
jgi:hypothetical protein